MNNIKYIFCDMDGTTIEGSYFKNSLDISFIKKWQSVGNKFIFATGRSWIEASYLAEKVDLHNHENKIICQNGSYVSDVNVFSPIKIKTINLSLIKSIYNFCKIENLILFISSLQDIRRHYYFNPKKIVMTRIDDERISYTQFNLLEEINLKNITFMYIDIENTEVAENIFIKLSQKFKNKINLFLNIEKENNMIMFTNIFATKASVIQEYAKENSISVEDIIVIGDGGNDIEMLKKFYNHSYAMGNASIKVKKAAKFITNEIENCGVSNVIKKYI